MSVSLAVKYRPQRPEDVVGQKSVVKILENQIESGNIKNVYLFAGCTGCGKTTMARIFASLVNGGVGEPFEIDAASNNNIESIRGIVKSAYERAIEGKYKVYILDEVHQLSIAAFQPLLKTFEEPPATTIFILCTTDPQKIPATILNRVQRFNFNRIPSQDIKERLRYVCKCEDFINYEEAIDYISKIANGCMREALTLLDKCVAYSTDLSIQNVITALGNYSYDTFFNLVNNMIDGNEREVLNLIDHIYDEGNDLKLFIDQYLKFIIDVSKYILFNSCDPTSIPASMEDCLKNAVNFENPLNYYTYVMDKLLDLKNMLKNDVDIKSTVEVVCLQITRMK